MWVRADVLLRRTPSGQGRAADAKRGVRRSAAGSASIGLRQEERGCCDGDRRRGRQQVKGMNQSAFDI